MSLSHSSFGVLLICRCGDKSSKLADICTAVTPRQEGVKDLLLLLEAPGQSGNQAQ
jgi:hypothetical protein